MLDLPAGAEDHESYAYKLSRRQALSQWLMGVSRPTAEEQLKQSDPVSFLRALTAQSLLYSRNMATCQTCSVC